MDQINAFSLILWIKSMHFSLLTIHLIFYISVINVTYVTYARTMSPRYMINAISSKSNFQNAYLEKNVPHYGSIFLAKCVTFGQQDLAFSASKMKTLWTDVYPSISSTLPANRYSILLRKKKQPLCQLLIDDDSYIDELLLIIYNWGSMVTAPL